MDQLLDSFVQYLSDTFGLSGLTVVIAFFIISSGANLVGRLIPDDATGWKSLVRKAAKIIGLYASNRVSAGVSVNKVARTLIEGEAQVRDPETKRFAKLGQVLDINAKSAENLVGGPFEKFREK